MSPRKRNRLPAQGFAIDPKTGEISEVVSITKATIKSIQDNLNEMHGLLKDCAKWEHSKVLDKRLEEFLRKVSP